MPVQGSEPASLADLRETLGGGGVSDDAIGQRPVSVDNLKSLMGGYLGGVVLYDDPNKRPVRDVNTDTVTLAQTVEGFRVLTVWLLTAMPGMDGQWNSSCVSFPTNVLAMNPPAYSPMVGVLTGQTSTRYTVRVTVLSGTTLTVTGEDSAIMRVVGYR